MICVKYTSWIFVFFPFVRCDNVSENRSRLTKCLSLYVFISFPFSFDIWNCISISVCCHVTCFYTNHQWRPHHANHKVGRAERFGTRRTHQGSRLREPVCMLVMEPSFWCSDHRFLFCGSWAVGAKCDGGGYNQVEIDLCDMRIPFPSCEPHPDNKNKKIRVLTLQLKDHCPMLQNLQTLFGSLCAKIDRENFANAGMVAPPPSECRLAPDGCPMDDAPPDQPPLVRQQAVVLQYGKVAPLLKIAKDSNVSVALKFDTADFFGM